MVGQKRVKKRGKPSDHCPNRPKNVTNMVQKGA